MPSSRSQYIQIPTRSSSEDSPTPSQPSTSLPSAARPPTRSGPSPVAAEVDALFRRWTSTIAERVRLKKSTSSKKRRRDFIDQRDREQVVEILASVFEVWESPAGKGKEKEVQEEVMTLDHEPPLSHEAFEE